jgi:hypothetical protein
MRSTRALLRTTMKAWTRAATEKLYSTGEEQYPNETEPEYIRRLLNPFYQYKREKLIPELRDVAITLQPDRAVINFIQTTPKRDILRSAACYIAKWFVSKTDALAMFGFGQMHVISRTHLQEILRPLNIKFEQTKFGTLLDVGAGCGTVADTLKALFSRIITTETSSYMAASLRERGYECVESDDPLNEERIRSISFDVITCFNVLDRCDKPISLLRSLKKILEYSGPNAVLVLAVVFPFSPYVEHGTEFFRPSEEISLGLGKKASWEDSVNAFKRWVLDIVGFKVLSITKVPYVSEGDYEKDWYTITDAIFVLSSKNNSSDV